jgi:hypothetical protein
VGDAPASLRLRGWLPRLAYLIELRPEARFTSGLEEAVFRHQDGVMNAVLEHLLLSLVAEGLMLAVAEPTSVVRGISQLP